MKRSNSKHSFAWLNATQFFGALNDNVFKLLVVFFLVDHLGFDRKSTIGLAAIVFVVPFLLFSHAAGILADRYSKQNIIFYAKCMETALMACGTGGHPAGQPLHALCPAVSHVYPKRILRPLEVRHYSGDW